MTDTLSAAAALRTVRVAILTQGRVTDLALPTTVPLRDVIPAVQRHVPAGEDASALGQQFTLAPIAGVPFALDASLDTVGVVDGDLLALQPVPVGPAAHGVVEDIADAAVIFADPRARSWGSEKIRELAGAALLLFVLTASAFAVAYRLRSGAVIGTYGVAALAAATTVAALVLRSRSRRLSGGLSIAALIPLAAAFALAVPGPPGPAQVMLAGAAVTAWSVVCLIVAGPALAFFTVAAVCGAAAVLGAAVAQFWQLPGQSMGCGLLVLALLVTIRAPQLAALSARIPLPVIPAPGDPAPSALSLSVLEDLPRRIRVTASYQTGFIGAAVILSSVGSLAVVGWADLAGPWAWYVVIAFSAAAILRARVWDSVPCKSWLLAQPFLVATGLLVLLTVQGRYPAAGLTLVAVAALTAAALTVSAYPEMAAPETYSLPLRRIVGMLASALDASLIPAMAYLVGLFSWVLER